MAYTRLLNRHNGPCFIPAATAASPECLITRATAILTPLATFLDSTWLPLRVYDDPAGPRGTSNSIKKHHQQQSEKDNSMSLFPATSNALYNSWIDQHEQSPTNTQNNHNSSLNPLHQSHSSLSMSSPVPQRSIWSTHGGDQGAGTKSPLEPPSVYQPTTKADAGSTEDLGMERMSLLSNNSRIMRQQHLPRGSNSSSTSSYSTNLPGLVHTSSESTTSASLPTLYYTNSSSHNNINNNSDDDAANANILQSSLRSFLDDEDDISYSASPTASRPIVAGPPGFVSHNLPPQPPRQTVGYKVAGNSNTRRRGNRNKLRQQKKVEHHHQQQQPQHTNQQVLLKHTSVNQHKALKERNSFSNQGGNNVTLEPLFERPYSAGEELAPLGANAASSLKRAVAAQQQQEDNRSNDPFIRSSGSGSEALRMLLGDEPSECSASNLRHSVRDLETSYSSMHHGSSSSLRLSASSPAVSPRTPHKQPPILPMQLPLPLSPLDFSLSTMYAQDDSTNSSEDDDDIILVQHILASERQHQHLQQQGGKDAGAINESGIPDDLLDDHSPTSLGKKREWLLRMNRKLQDVPVGELDPSAVPISAIMNAWAKTKSAQGASMVEMWLRRAQEEFSAGNHRILPTTKMYTMAGT
jgi:hypothetical protein